MRTREIREAMTDARLSLIHAWSMRSDSAASAECILSALTEIQMVLDELDRPSTTAEDDEPAAGDVVEAPSEVSRLARALQSKARPQ